MSEFRLRDDLTRTVTGDFAWPLGIVPGQGPVPQQGYTIDFTRGDDDEPDTYTFQVVLSHERLAPLLHEAFGLLSDAVHPIVEVGSRDAYRTVDVYMADEPLARDSFVESWKAFETVLLEDGRIAAGANSEDPVVEVFVDHLKQLIVHVPPSMRDQAEAILQQAGLPELPQGWRDEDRDALADRCEVRPVLVQDELEYPDLDDVLHVLCHAWGLDLNIDPDTNVDESGRPLGLTLWQATVVLDEIDGEREGAYGMVWVTAGSLNEVHDLVDGALGEHEAWRIGEVPYVDRVAYDDRPDELRDLEPRREAPAVHLVQIDWNGEIVEEWRGA